MSSRTTNSDVPTRPVVVNATDQAGGEDPGAKYEATGRRLAAETRLFVRLLPVPARGVRGMAEFLGVDRNLCQRVLAAAKADGMEFLLACPSAAQFQRLVEGAALKGINEERLVGFRSAVEQYSALEVEGDRAPGAMRRRIREIVSGGSHPAPRAAADDPMTALHRAGVAVAGCELEARINVALMWPRADMRTGVHVLMIQGHVGYTARRHGMPIAVQFADWVHDQAGRPIVETLSGEAGTGAKRVLLREFCSEPLPLLSPSGDPDSLEHVIDVAALSADSRVNVFTAVSTMQEPHPLLDEEDRIRSFNAHMRLPSKRFLFDVFLHRSLASACVPGTAVKTWSPNLHLDPVGDWANVIPGGPRLEILGPDPRQISSSAWERHPEVVRRAFSLAGREMGEFVGYRLDAPMPVWNSHYVVSFDFTHAPQAGA